MVISKRTLILFVACMFIIPVALAIPGRALLLPTVARLYTRTGQYPEVVYVPYYKEGPSVTARSAVLIEATTGTVVFGKNEHMRMHPASTTKIMTALLAIELGDTESTVIVSGKAASTPGSSLWLRKGQQIRLEDLIRGTMLRSGNDGCVAIAEHVAGSESNFVRMMNLKAQKLGANSTGC